MHPMLESLSKKELNKLWDAKIIFSVRHSRWVEKLVVVRKNKGEIWLCIDFKNMNKASKKYNYLVFPIEAILQCIYGSEMLSLLEESFGYNQIIVSHPN